MDSPLTKPLIVPVGSGPFNSKVEGDPPRNVIAAESDAFSTSVVD